MSEAKHTALPWKKSSGSREKLIDNHGNEVANCCSSRPRVECEAKADLILRACNSHYQLLSACEEMVKAAKASGRTIGFDSSVLDLAMNAIAKAKGENTGAEMARLEDAAAERAKEPV